MAVTCFPVLSGALEMKAKVPRNCLHPTIEIDLAEIVI
jgi:hypothetical protein